MASKPKADHHGPFRADQLRDGDRYELSNGHPIYCAPSGREHAGPNLIGAAALETDPDVDWAGVDAGFSPDEGTLRAPDIAIAPPIAPKGDERGWIRGAPPLAVEYAGMGQDEEDLQAKIAELLRNGATQVWVVRLLGTRRVEVYRADAPMRLAHPGDSLTAPGLLRNPVPVEALYDREAGHRAVLRNLLQRQGYADLDAVRSEGAEQGVARAIIALLEDRGLAVDAPTRARVKACRDQDQLRRWLLAAAKAEDTGDLFR